jgi:hypothetical protein
MADPREERKRALREELDKLETEDIESPAPNPEAPTIANPSEGRTLFGGKKGAGRVTFGGDLERQQTEELATQMMRSTEHQLQTASEQVERISWIETEGSRHLAQDPDKHGELAITRFELILGNGKVYTLEGPVINMKIQN